MARRSSLAILAVMLAACGGSSTPTPMPFDVWVAMSRVTIDAIHERTDGATRPAAALPVVRLAEEELAWLDSEPPAPCYATAHRRYREYLTALRTVMVAVRDGNTPAESDQTRLDEATTELTDEIYRAGDACARE